MIKFIKRLVDAQFTLNLKFSNRIREGQTQTDWPQDEEEAHLNHVVDLHFGARGIQVERKNMSRDRNADVPRLTNALHICLHIC